jgi:DNA-binding NarL/FixJ family response regulator
VIRVCLVEDQNLVRQGLRTLLELAGDIEITAEAQDGDEAIETIRRLQPDVVLLDMYLPKASGMEVLQALQRSNELPPTLILTTFDEDELVLGGLRAGAKGFLLKDVKLEQLTAAIRTLAAGGTFIQPAITERLLQNRHRIRCDFPSTAIPDPLSERELETLSLMARGYNNREIADALAIAEGTVKNYVSSVLAKMGVRDRTRAVLKAIESGLL